ncbi:MAG: AraC family transcriptional regulator [Sphingomonadales bacterium]|nr:AraC family transcriptional regulator [Sphingomonadales bacterium]
MTGADGSSHTRFIAPHPRLQPYLSAYYFTSIDTLDGEPVFDWMNPEWASVRFRYSGDTLGGFVGQSCATFRRRILSGRQVLRAPLPPDMRVLRASGFCPWDGACLSTSLPTLGRTGLMMPLWSKRRLHFADMMQAAVSAQNLDEMAARFDAILLDALDNRPLIDATTEQRVRAAHAALMDPEIASVAQLAERLQLSIAQLQRFSLRIFGFSPKLLLRRQRFVRTLAVIMRDPESNWSDALDANYYDQAHFNRDFRQFFKMSPREYRPIRTRLSVRRRGRGWWRWAIRCKRCKSLASGNGH